MIDPKKVNIGDELIHNVKGLIVVEGIHPHCGDYLITTNESWVYLNNCRIKSTWNRLKRKYQFI